MGSSYAQMIAILLPQLPLIGKTSVLHALNLTAQAKYMDLQSELAVSVLRALCVPSDKRGVAEVQRYTLRDPGIKGRIWVSKYACPKPPETSIREGLLAAIRNLKDSECASQVAQPDIVPVEAEWTGYRAGASTDSRLPAISDKELYVELQKECSSPATTLYFHGGAYYLMDPASHRATTKKLAKLSGGKVYSVRYRLAPQNPFPAALLDALMSYFALLYPPPGSYHHAVKPEHIVLAGDSAGGNLALALLQTLLQLRRQAAKVTWFGSERDVPLPAGVAVSSPWLDMTQSFPSWEANWKFDYLPRPSEVKKTEVPADHIWPAKPPRKHMYVDDAFLMHPLASLVVNQSWESSPPIWMCVGWEMLADEIKFLAKKLTEDGVPVVFEEFEAMPHCFSLILGSLPGTRKCFDDWAGFIKAATQNPADIGSRAFAIKAKSLEEVKLEFSDLSSTSLDAVRQRIRKRIKSSSFADTTASKL